MAEELQLVVLDAQILETMREEGQKGLEKLGIPRLPTPAELISKAIDVVKDGAGEHDWSFTASFAAGAEFGWLKLGPSIELEVTVEKAAKQDS